MAQKDHNIVQYIEKRLLQNEFFFKYIFKKTEKIVYSVLYTIRHNTRKDILLEHLEQSSFSLMDTALRSLTRRDIERDAVLYELIEGYFTLESRIRMAEAGGSMSGEIARTFLAEIEGIYRSIERMRHESQRETVQAVSSSRGSSDIRQRVERAMPRTAERGGEQEAGYGGVGGKENRRERIRAIIKDRKEVSIKDISDIITDISEKTIQRELIAMIDEGQIIRQGERRWSRYSISE